MMFPGWRERMPKAQSFKEQFIGDIMAQEKNLILGPTGTSASAVHPPGKGPAVGKHARQMHDTETHGLSNV